MPAVEPTDTISLPLPRAIVVVVSAEPATVTSEDLLAAVRSMMVSEAETVLASTVTFLVVPAAVYRSIIPASPAVTEA